jgi:hypothetical protein
MVSELCWCYTEVPRSKLVLGGLLVGVEVTDLLYGSEPAAVHSRLTELVKESFLVYLYRGRTARGNKRCGQY